MRASSSSRCALTMFAGVCCAAIAAAAELPDKPGYNRHVRPILADTCFVCHGPDSGTRRAKLRLDLREEAVRQRRGRHAIVPGSPQASEAIKRIFSDDEFERMPPPDSRLSLTAEQKELLRRWVENGAEYEPHWSFVPLPGQVSAPATADALWPRSELDRFVLARMQNEGLSPAPEASRERWLRRVTFDLTGLPPTQEQLDEFLADNAPEAYERVVDRLLSSPRFGEKMAVHWLDVARYADSFGYQADLDAHAWPYRDWVIAAFNGNLPFDQFITQQLAGDLLPNATTAQRLATAFLRVHRKTQEGGSIEEEFRQDGISDRVHTVGTAFMGLTLECARCHDHKFDPITMRDYYALGAFFNSIDEWGLLHGNGAIQPHPVLYLTTPEQDETRGRLRHAVARAERDLIGLCESRASEFRRWLAGPHGESSPLPDLEGRYSLDDAPENKLANAARPDQPGTFKPANRLVPGRVGQAVNFTGDDSITVTHAGCQHMEDPVSVAFWLMPGEEYPRAVVFHNSNGWDPGYNGYELLLEEGRLRWMFAREWPGNCIAVRTREALPVRTWTHVVVTYDGSARAAGLRVYLDGRRAEVEVLRDRLVKDCGDGGRIDFGERRRDNGLRDGFVDEIHVFGRAISGIEAAQLHDGVSLTALLARCTGGVATVASGSSHSVSDAELADLREYYFSAIDPEARAAATGLRRARSELRALMDQVREVPVMAEMPAPRPAYILARGDYDAPRDQPVDRDTPGALPPFPADAPRNRLGLARWLTQPDHPLTARVLVNRIWQEFFGRGLVVTAENFGLQGELPSHPELLDWLARDFVAHGWDFKRFCRQLVLSATYRQDSRADAELRSRDPDNRLLTRGPLKRLGAEMLRDHALASGGLLVDQIGGPPVKPYQPEGSMWRALNNFLPEYQRDTGEGLYRRSLYTFWRRTTPPPNMMVFDAAGREICSVRRQLTLTPLQPLVLLNDPQFVEAARAFGERMLKEGGTTPEARTAWGFREATGRAVTSAEAKVLCALYDEQLAYFRQDPSRAEKLLKVGDYRHEVSLPADELAAAAVTAGALLSLDATIMLR